MDIRQFIREPLTLAIAGLAGTGVLAGAAVYAMKLVPGEGPPAVALAVAIPLVGILGGLWLLARTWRPLAMRTGQSAGWAATLTGFFLVGTTLITLYLTSGPYTQLFCDWETAETCSVNAIVTMHTAGLVVPWTLAGIPALLLLSTRTKPEPAGE